MADKKISQLTPATTPVAGTEVFPAVQSGSTVKVAINDLFARGVNFLTVSGANRAPSTYGNLHVASTSDAAAFNGGNLSFGGRALATGNQYTFGSIKFASDAATVTGWDTYASLSLTNSDSSVSEKVIFKNNGDINALSGNFVPGTAGKGIDFSANTNAPGMTSELLDWYEEGTWTPTQGNFGTWTAPVFNARYTRIGNQVTVFLQQTQGTIASDGAGKKIGGLPFNPAVSGSAVATNGSVQSVSDLLIYPGNEIFFTADTGSQSSLTFTATYTV